MLISTSFFEKRRFCIPPKISGCRLTANALITFFSTMDPSAKKQKVEPNARLYSKAFASSARVENIIHELGIEDQVAIEPLASIEEIKKEWYLKLHPQGKIPVYVEGDPANPDFVLTESVAIALYLLEKYDTEGRLLSKTDPVQRAKTFQFGSFAASEAYKVVADIFLQSDHNTDKPHLKNPDLVPGIKKTWVDSIVKFLVAQIGDKPFLLGDKPTAGDFFIGYELIGASYFQLPMTDPILAAYYERLSALPSFKKTYGLP